MESIFSKDPIDTIFGSVKPVERPIDSALYATATETSSDLMPAMLPDEPLAKK